MSEAYAKLSTSDFAICLQDRSNWLAEENLGLNENFEDLF